MSDRVFKRVVCGRSPAALHPSTATDLRLCIILRLILQNLDRGCNSRIQVTRFRATRLASKFLNSDLQESWTITAVAINGVKKTNDSRN
ncbi:hypothetical protein QTP88_012336 [Uroleucon formosanum]